MLYSVNGYAIVSRWYSRRVTVWVALEIIKLFSFSSEGNELTSFVMEPGRLYW